MNFDKIVKGIGMSWNKVWTPLFCVHPRCLAHLKLHTINMVINYSLNIDATIIMSKPNTVYHAKYNLGFYGSP